MQRDEQRREFEGGREREQGRGRSDVESEGMEGGGRSGQRYSGREDRSGPEQRGEDYRAYGYGGESYGGSRQGQGGYGGRYFGTDYPGQGYSAGQGYGALGQGGVGQDSGGGRGAGGGGYGGRGQGYGSQSDAEQGGRGHSREDRSFGGSRYGRAESTLPERGDYGSQGRGYASRFSGGGPGYGPQSRFEERPGWGSIGGMAQSQDWERSGQRRGGYSNIFDEERGRGSRQGQSFRGRGPKGYARSDERIREDVSSRLEDAEDLDPSEVSVEVDDGQVKLSGQVDSRWAKRYCEDLAYQVRGVKNVQNQLDVEGREREQGRQAEGEQERQRRSRTEAEPIQQQANP